MKEIKLTNNKTAEIDEEGTIQITKILEPDKEVLFYSNDLVLEINDIPILYDKLIRKNMFSNTPISKNETIKQKI